MRPLCFVIVGAGLVIPFIAPNILAQGSPRQLEFRGQVLFPAGTVPPRRWITVNLLAVGTPYYSRTVAQRDGRFRFKHLDSGSYTLLISIPRVGVVSRSVEITPSFADAKGRIERQFEFTADQLALLLHPENRATVSVRELQISFGARRDFEKAQARLRRKDDGGAIQHLESAVERSPEFLEAINTLGIIYYQRRQYDQAERYFRRALEIDEDAVEPLVNLGGVLLTQGKGKEAIVVNQRAIEALPHDALAAAQLGFSYYLQGEYGDSIMYLDRTKELDPAHFTSPQLTLAQIFMRLQQAENAIEEIDEFLQLRPDSPDSAKARELRQRALEIIERQASSQKTGS
ncbi:MAG: tetratricopeptide repeat protein [Acidobacteria bacterium]|nr:tetratricopeptide repeat protein [Acidobacteriota bacterium]